MHLKNFSLLTQPDGEIKLAPAYDLLCTKIALPDDTEETALTINGKKRKLTKKDFDSLAANLRIPEKTAERIYSRFKEALPTSERLIHTSFLPANMKEQYIAILRANAAKVGLL